jgi:NAD(P)-dependent dehydrogenase (short-subunit alcohol dehydrogenase family)
LDIRDGAGWARAAETATQKFGAVHLLCNNAGISPFFKPVEEIEEDAWRLMLDVTLTGAFLGVRTFLPRMKAHGEGGHIVNVASMCGLDPQPGMADYDAAKFGVVGLSEAIRDELAPVGIGVSVLCPGPVRTSLWRTSRKVRGLPDTEAPPSQAGSASPDGRDPDWVGRRVMRGVIDNELYIFTHPERLRDIDRRFETIRAGFEATTAHLALDPIS